MKRVLTYGTFDLLHYGHIRLLKRAKELGDYLIVALSTEEFNRIKGKTTYHSYEVRKEMLEALRSVDLVIPEETWEQKINDVIDNQVDVVVMGGDWANSERFEYLKAYCEVVYLERTNGISTTQIKDDLNNNNGNHD
jgi:glycerol-3-phosphate cytidylyltransferase